MFFNVHGKFKDDMEADLAKRRRTAGLAEQKPPMLERTVAAPPATIPDSTKDRIGTRCSVTIRFCCYTIAGTISP